MNIWSLLITLIVAIVIWMFAFPGINFRNQPNNVGAEKKMREQVNQVETETTQQVNQARQIQQEEQKNLNENNQ